jgi:hypothetical protein
MFGLQHREYLLARFASSLFDLLAMVINVKS